jgi:GTP cyclohydrolase IIa
MHPKGVKRGESNVGTTVTTQVTLIQLDNYGPWTTTPSPRPEPDLQALQADLYADLSRLFGVADAYTFFARFDNMVGITTGVDRGLHARIQETLGNRYPVTVSLAAATHERPADALAAATERLQEAGSAQSADRSEVLAVPERDENGDRTRIAHFDVVDATARFTDAVDAYETHLHIRRATHELSTHLHETHGALAFFVGGDNVIAACPAMDRADYEAALDHVEEAAGVDLKVGVGCAEAATTAGMAAKEALEVCREGDARVEGDLPAVPDAD